MLSDMPLKFHSGFDTGFAGVRANDVDMFASFHAQLRLRSMLNLTLIPIQWGLYGNGSSGQRAGGTHPGDGA